jgi:hypothetical protein
MKKSTPELTLFLDSLTRAARSLGLTDAAWAQRAGLRKETLSRLRRRSSCDLTTLIALGEVVGARLVVARDNLPDSSPDGHFPMEVGRDYEQRLLELCASRRLEPEAWAALGPRFFMAGLAVMVASVAGFDRRGLLDLAEHLHPGSSEPAVFTKWLKRSAVRPTRFLSLLGMEAKYAA